MIERHDESALHGNNSRDVHRNEEKIRIDAIVQFFMKCWVNVWKYSSLDYSAFADPKMTQKLGAFPANGKQYTDMGGKHHYANATGNSHVWCKVWQSIKWWFSQIELDILNM